MTGASSHPEIANLCDLAYLFFRRPPRRRFREAVRFFLPMDGYFRRTAARTRFFSAGDPCWLTLDNALRAWALSWIGYLRLPGRAKDFFDSLFRLPAFELSVTPTAASTARQSNAADPPRHHAPTDSKPPRTPEPRRPCDPWPAHTRPARPPSRAGRPASGTSAPGTARPGSRPW